MIRSMGFGEKMFDAVVWAVLALVALVVTVPLWYLVMMSVTPFEIWSRTGGTLFVPPNQMTLEGYRQLLASVRLPRAFGVSVFITLAGTALNLAFTTLLAYPLSRRNFPLRTPLLLAVIFTMLFSGGLIPSYLVVRQLGLLNTYWALILPNLISGFNLLVMKAFFESLPHEIEEAARIDGASDWQVLWQIVLPLSKPIMATVGLFYAVGHWNSFFDAILYISDAKMQPLQVVLRSILSAGNVNEYADPDAAFMPLDTLRMAAVVLATLPLLFVYPWLQKHFTAGTLLGSVKE
ncbi:MAG TPA: carbohydrate ABC transporter permease [Roseiflexaceae bacterium]|nr:carbohydrate ABC transporter permease [Roseiflexaceae bacterium]